MSDTMRDAFEAWYVANAFDYVKNPIGSRECGLQWAAWQAAQSQPAPPTGPNYKDCSHPSCGCEEGQCKADEYNDRMKAEYDAKVGALIYQGNTVSYMYSKAKNYGDTVLRMWNMLDKAGFRTSDKNGNHVETMLSRALAASDPKFDMAAIVNISKAFRPSTCGDDWSAGFVSGAHFWASKKGEL